MPWLAAIPLELIVFAVVFGSLAIWVLTATDRRRSWRPRGYHTGPPVRRMHDFTSPVIRPNTWTGNPIDPAEQLRAVMAGSFTAKQVLSRTEAKVMAAAEAAIAEAGLPWRVLAQVALGEVLASPDEAAFRAINAKRVDLLIMSERRMPLAAIEYQGDGHWQGEAPARDAVKKEALRRAGVSYIEVTPSHGAEDLRREIARLAFQTTARLVGKFPAA